VLVAAAAKGGKSGFGGYKKVKEAQRIGEKARSRQGWHESRLKAARKRCDGALVDLGREREAVFSESMPAFLAVLGSLRNAEVAATAFADEFSIDEIPHGELHELALKQIELVGTAAAGAISGVAASSAATAAVGAVGVASTGTAISTLSGAAATNATLAWFGGGALAAGGAGMAGGAAVIGGIVVAPAILVGGVIFDRQSGKLLDRAKTNAATVDAWVAKASAARLRFNAARETANKGATALAAGRVRLTEWVDRLSGTAEGNQDVASWSAEEQDHLQATANLAGLLVGLAAAPLLADDGGLDPVFERALERLAG